jgi:hypothetical protein
MYTPEKPSHIGIPESDLHKLLSINYKSGKKAGVFPRPLALKNVGFARKTIAAIKKELGADLKAGRKDGQKTVDHAFRLILCNLVACVFERRPLALSGSNSAYNKETPLNKMFLTKAAVGKVISALIEHKYLVFKQGNNLKETTNTYTPTEKLEVLLIPLLYSVYEPYTNETQLIVFKEPKDKKANKKVVGSRLLTINGLFGSLASDKHIKRRSSLDLSLPPHHHDLVALRRINEALKDCSYALQSPVVRIFSDEDPMRGGRLYTRLQTLPDKRARIRINTLFNGEPVAEVDLSANHPRMLMALKGKELPADFYDEVAKATKTTRDQVKFLLMKAIGASNRAISLKPDVDQKDWFKKDFIVLPEQRKAIDSYLEQHHSDLFESLYRGMGVFLQGLEGDILLKTMIRLLDQGIPSLPIHDAVYVQANYASQAQQAICEAWSDCLGIDFKPITKIDLTTNGD